MGDDNYVELFSTTKAHYLVGNANAMGWLYRLHPVSDKHFSYNSFQRSGGLQICVKEIIRKGYLGIWESKGSVNGRQSRGRVSEKQPWEREV